MQWKLDPKHYLTFEEYTEPLDDGIVTKLAQQVSHPIDTFQMIKSNFRYVSTGASTIFTVKTMEKHKIVGGCSEHSLLTAAILRKAGIPTAILDAIHIPYLYDYNILFEKMRPYPTEYDKYYTIKPRSMHTVNLVYWKGKWYLLDTTSFIFTRYFSRTLYKQGYVPIAVHRGYSDLGIKNKKAKFDYLFRKLKEIFPIEFEEDLLFPEYQLYL